MKDGRINIEQFADHLKMCKVMILIRRDTIGLGPLLITFDPHFNSSQKEPSPIEREDMVIINWALTFTGNCWRPLDVDHSLLLQTHARVVILGIRIM